MPDVSRSDSQRSDTSLRPRVSFNRDVHVKRIVSRDDPEVSKIPSGDATAPLFVRRKHLATGHKDNRPFVHLHEGEKVSKTPEKLPGKFNSLPTRKKHRKGSTESVNSVQPNHEREDSSKLTRSNSRTQKEKGSLFNIFKRSEKAAAPDSSKLKRSVSDVSGLKSRTTGRRSSSDSIDSGKHNFVTKKNQLSPIIEVSTPRDDYFNDAAVFNTKSKQLKEKWADNENEKKGKNGNKLAKNKINDKNKENKNNTAVSVKDTTKKKGVRNLFRKESKKSKDEPKRDLKTEKKNLKNSINNNIVEEKRRDSAKSFSDRSEENTNPNLIQEKIKSFEKLNDIAGDMIHCSQKPPEKIPLTRGNNVDKMVKRLNNNKNSLPRMTSNVLITPSDSVGHNNNQPFSYTQPIAEREHADPQTEMFNSPSSPVIYAKIVSGADNPQINGKHKQTVHTFYKSRRKYFPHSDSDEGLGYEENSFNTKYESSNVRPEEKGNKFDSSGMDEFPITPKYKYIPTNFGDSEYETDPVNLDSSARGQGDGMDSKRRESLTEPHMYNDDHHNKSNDGLFISNGRSNLSYRRDLLESRLNSRRLGEKNSTLNRSSPEILHKMNSPVVSRTVTEMRSSNIRHGSTSPVDFRTRNVSESDREAHIEKQHKESRIIHERHTDSRQLFEYEQIYDCANEVYEGKPQTVMSPSSYHPSDNINNAFNKYKQKSEKSMLKDRDHYKSTPDIHSDAYDVPYKNGTHFVSETYHDSLRRHKHDAKPEDTNKVKKKYFMHSRDRKDKYGDSGIENDFNRSPGENGKITQSYHQRSNNDSEDEGFASSLLIASEKQHTEDNFDIMNGHQRKGYDSDKEGRMYVKENQHETLFRRKEPNKNKHEYVHRERSIDDGSHYDPRIDKNLDGKRETLKPVEKKPAKMSSLEKMKKLFSRDSSKKTKNTTSVGDRPDMVRDEYLRARYKEYRGNSPGMDKHSSKGRDYVDRPDDKHSSKSKEYLDKVDEKHRSKEYLERADGKRESRSREHLDDKHSNKNKECLERDDKQGNRSREYLDDKHMSKSREYVDDKHMSKSREYLHKGGEERHFSRSREHLDKGDERQTGRSREYPDKGDEKQAGRNREYPDKGDERQSSRSREYLDRVDKQFSRSREYLNRDDKYRSKSREYLDKTEDKQFSRNREYLEKGDNKHNSKSREYLNKPEEQHHSESRHTENLQPHDYSNRRRVATPSPSPPRNVNKHVEKVRQEKSNHEGWFKSLDRFSLKKNKPEKTTKENIKDNLPKDSHPPPTKNLRFFGDTDTEGNDSVRRKPSLRSRTDAHTFATSTPAKGRSQSTRNLHNISEEFDNSTDSLHNNNNYRSIPNIPESDMDMKGRRQASKSPVAQREKVNTLKMKNDKRNRKKRNEASSADSSVEGDSSQQSQRSVVYLHAATVGDIPGPHYLSKNGRRVEPTSTMTKKTLSRSFSVLAPWKMRHPNEGSEIDYSSSTMKSTKSGRTESKPSEKSSKENANKNGYTLKRKSKSKEALSHTLSRKSEDNLARGGSSTLYKKREKQPNENTRYMRDDKKMSKKSMSVESLGHDKYSAKKKKDPKVISRSVSLPRDTEKSAGWFNTSKKDKRK